MLTETVPVALPPELVMVTDEEHPTTGSDLPVDGSFERA